MNGFTNLELAALHSIVSETPELTADLKRQLEKATVANRKNTGGGFFTTITVPADVVYVTTPRVLGYATHARVDGLEHGLGFVLFMKEGRLDMLEGYAWGPENTALLNLFDLTFEIFNAPIRRIT